MSRAREVVAIEYCKKAKKSQDQNNYHDALIHSDNAIQADNTYAEGYYRRANALSDIGKKYQCREESLHAISDYSVAIFLAKNYPQLIVTAYLRRGITYGELGYFDHAVEDFEKAKPLLSPDVDVRTLCLYATTYLARAKHLASHGNAEKSLSDKGKAIVAYYEAIKKGGNYFESASKELTSFITSLTKKELLKIIETIKPRTMQLEILKDCQKRETVLGSFMWSKMWLYEPTLANSSTQQKIAALIIELEKTPEIKIEEETLVDEDHLTTCLRRAEQYEKINEFELAVTYLEAYLTFYKTTYGAHTLIAINTHYRLGVLYHNKLDQAAYGIFHFDQSIKGAPYNAQFRAARGAAYESRFEIRMKMKEKADALKDLKRAILDYCAIEPTPLDKLQSLLTRKDKKDIEEAIKTMSPNDQEIAREKLQLAHPNRDPQNTSWKTVTSFLFPATPVPREPQKANPGDYELAVFSPTRRKNS